MILSIIIKNTSNIEKTMMKAIQLSMNLDMLRYEALWMFAMIHKMITVHDDFLLRNIVFLPLRTWQKPHSNHILLYLTKNCENLKLWVYCSSLKHCCIHSLSIGSHKLWTNCKKFKTDGIFRDTTLLTLTSTKKLIQRYKEEQSISFPNKYVA